MGWDVERFVNKTEVMEEVMCSNCIEHFPYTVIYTQILSNGLHHCTTFIEHDRVKRVISMLEKH